ncbi:MAG: hypothetical protein K2J78_03175 [Muribaculaceae bacterium]|nr:hypothetical protein [Muribaculaceae bacterium]
MDTDKLPDPSGTLNVHAATATHNTQSDTASIWRMFIRTLFIVIRSVIWASTFLFSTPQPLGWLRGIVIERGVDTELCCYYLLQDLKQFVCYLIYIFIWSLPFVKVRKMWYTLRTDILSILAALLLNTVLYLIYVQWFS